MPSVPKSVTHPVETHEQNLNATLTLLTAAREARVDRFISASSSSIYGDNDAPAKREDLPPQPLSPYALQKYAAERYGQLFHRLYGVPVVSLRYFNVFGARQAFDSPYSGVIAKFCTGFLRNEAPVIFGDGLQSRDFTHIRNVVSANLLAIDSPAERVAGGVFNVACGESISLLRLVSDLNRLTGRTLQPRFEPERVGDVKHSRADIGSARERLGYTPLVDWETGLAETLDWYRSQK
jgi:UDP-glucose 4-epimerase